MADLHNAMEQEKQKLMDTNEIGFYVNSRVGLAFTPQILDTLVHACKEFKNSVFIVYDISKSNFGMQPLHAYRLSEKATATLMASERGLIQQAIKNSGLTVTEFFEEIPIRIHRNHMQQAYLFDYIQPEMPAFNTNVFKLANSNYFCQHVHSSMEITEALTMQNKERIDKLQSQVTRMRKYKGKDGQVQATEADANKLDYFLMSK